MKKNDEIFNEFDIDLETANRIAKEYPSLSDSARERMFNMTQEKMNMTNNANETDANSVSGVEKYNRPRWIKFAGMAASIAIIAGGIGGESYLLHKMKNTAPGSSSVTETTTTSSVTEVTTTSDVTTTVTTTTAAAETTTAIDESTPEGIAHKLTDNYWDYECFFDVTARIRGDFEGTDSLKLNCTMHYDTLTSDAELEYCKTTDERLTEKTMDGVKKLYNTYYGENYDPFYSVNAEYTNNNALFGPSFTADTLPADRKIDHAYTYIEYEGELYQKCFHKDYILGNHWSDDQTEVTDVTENSFTLKRKFNNNANGMYDETHGEVTFKIAFDEAAQDWRIEQKDIDYDYPSTSAAVN